MGRFSVSMVAAALAWGTAAVAQERPVIRVAYLASNPAQAVTDPASGEARGVVIDLGRELGRRRGAEVTFNRLASPQAVIDAVRAGDADIGFVAYNPERAGPVAFSRPYLLVQQTFIVSDRSAIRSVRDIDRPNLKIGATRADSIALYLARTLKQAQLVEITDATRAEVPAMLRSGALDAFGANRQRLSGEIQKAPGLRLLADDLYGVEQTIIVAQEKAALLPGLNAFIEDVLRSGFLKQAIDRSGVAGIAPAPP